MVFVGGIGGVERVNQVLGLRVITCNGSEA